MRPVLAVSLVAAVVAVGYAGYQFTPGRTARPKAVAPLISADPTPYRVIPMNADKVVRRPEATPSPKVAEATSREAEATAAPAAPVVDQGRPDVLASVARTLQDMRPDEARGEAAAGAVAPASAGLTQVQADALRQVAARRKVRPVTRLSFPLETGADVPAQVFLHPVPPEVAALSPSPLGFAVVGNRMVVVASDTRKVVAVSGE